MLNQAGTNLATTHPQNISTLKAWALASRPRTLPAAVAPVVVASAAAIGSRDFVFLPAASALLVALLLQIGVNLANDYFDFKKGIDTEERQGPVVRPDLRDRHPLLKDAARPR